MSNFPEEEYLLRLLPLPSREVTPVEEEAADVRREEGAGVAEEEQAEAVVNGALAAGAGDDDRRGVAVFRRLRRRDWEEGRVDEDASGRADSDSRDLLRAFRSSYASKRKNGPQCSAEEGGNVIAVYIVWIRGVRKRARL